MNMEHKPKIRAAIYARSAVVDEPEIVRQINNALKLVNENGECLVGVYAESGISGMTSIERPEFKRLMADAKDGRFTKLYIRDLDRISRDVRKLMAAYKTLRKNGVTIDAPRVDSFELLSSSSKGLDSPVQCVINRVI
jgi:site-specific DNA recombinase